MEEETFQLHEFDSGIRSAYSYAPPSTSQTVAEWCRQFQLSESLRVLGSMSGQLSIKGLRSDVRYWEDGNKPKLGQPIIAYIAKRLIECTEDNSQLTVAALSSFFDAAALWHGLPEPKLDKGISTLLRLCYQFEYELPLRYLAPRILMLFDVLWHQTKEARKIDVKKEIEQLFNGISLDDNLAFAEQAWIRAAPLGLIETEYRGLSPFFDASGNRASYENINSWLDAISTDYRGFIRASSNTPTMDDEAYEKYRFNPLFKYPLIRIQEASPRAAGIYIAPIPKMILYRSTRGLYHALREKFWDMKDASFSNAFGHVFERYVFELLKHSEWGDYFQPSRRYGANGSNPDCMVNDSNDVVFIQIKQAGLFLDAKLNGKVDDVIRDLGKSIAEAVEQHWQFENDIDSEKYPELQDLSGKNIERVIVIYDEVSLLNAQLRPLIKAALSTSTNRIRDGKPPLPIPDDYSYHVLTVSEFEQLSSIKGVRLFDLLRKKATDEDLTPLDFMPFIIQMFGDPKNELLDSKIDNFSQPIKRAIAASKSAESL